MPSANVVDLKAFGWFAARFPRGHPLRGLPTCDVYSLPPQMAVFIRAVLVLGAAQHAFSAQARFELKNVT